MILDSKIQSSRSWSSFLLCLSPLFLLFRSRSTYFFSFFFTGFFSCLLLHSVRLVFILGTTTQKIGVANDRKYWDDHIKSRCDERNVLTSFPQLLLRKTNKISASLKATNVTRIWTVVHYSETNRTLLNITTAQKKKNAALCARCNMSWKYWIQCWKTWFFETGKLCAEYLRKYTDETCEMEKNRLGCEN